MTAAVESTFGHRVRIRICGIAIEDDKILLINHNTVGEKGYLWAPPGGGLDYGESSEEALVREYKEETGLDIAVKEFLFVNEFFAPPLHAIELFFRIEITGGILSKGSDPEISAEGQIIQDIQYWTYKDILLENPLVFHSIFQKATTLSQLLSLRGHFKNINP